MQQWKWLYMAAHASMGWNDAEETTESRMHSCNPNQSYWREQEVGAGATAVEQLVGANLSLSEAAAPELGWVTSQGQLRSAASAEMSASFHAPWNMCMSEMYKMCLVWFKDWITYVVTFGGHYMVRDGEGTESIT